MTAKLIYLNTYEAKYVVCCAAMGECTKSKEKERRYSYGEELCISASDSHKLGDQYM
jgi:hypothetical protein